MLMPPLIQKWNVLKDEDKDLFPLLEVSGIPKYTVASIHSYWLNIGRNNFTSSLTNLLSPVVAVGANAGDIVLGCVRTGNIVRAITTSNLYVLSQNFRYGLVVTLSRSSSTASNFRTY
jgi:hypothetical protein